MLADRRDVTSGRCGQFLTLAPGADYELSLDARVASGNKRIWFFMFHHGNRGVRTDY